MDVARKKRIKRDWPGVFADFDRSGMTVKEFCRSRGMSQSIFYRRRKDYGSSDTPPAASLGRGDFIEFKPGTSSRRPALITFGDQIELSISNDCDKELLRAIIAQLKGSLC